MQRSDTPEPDGCDTSDDEASQEPSSLYTQLQLYILGVFLANVLTGTLICIWGILSGFQAPLLWALLCSIALRDLKQWLVAACRQRLSEERCAHLCSSQPWQTFCWLEGVNLVPSHTGATAQDTPDDTR